MNAKKHITARLAGIANVKSVRKGRGTARNWLYITTDASVPRDHRWKIEAELVEAGLCGTFYGDMGGDRIPSVNWFVCRALDA